MFKNKEDAKSLERFLASCKEVMEMYEVMENSGMKKYENAIERYTRCNVLSDKNDNYVHSGQAREDMNSLYELLEAYKNALEVLSSNEDCVLDYSETTCQRDCFQCWRGYCENGKSR